MSSSAPLAVVFGGSGFVGRYITRRLAKAGWRVRVAVRRPNEAGFTRPYGVVGQVEPVFCNIRDDASVAAALVGADAAINAVGTFDKSGKNNFDAVQNVAAGRIARLAAAAGVKKLVHISALGADPAAESLYYSSKGKGEEAVFAAYPSAIVLRPSVIFGIEDKFFNRFAGMARVSPVLPLAGASTRFQPVYVDDVAAAAVNALTLDADPGIYELAGPEDYTLRELIDGILNFTQLRRLVLPLPLPIAALLGSALDLGSALTGRLFSNTILTRDQVRMLKVDSVAEAGHPGLAALGVQPTDMSAILPDYLWRFRKAGQFDAIKDSAKRLKKS